MPDVREADGGYRGTSGHGYDVAMSDEGVPAVSRRWGVVLVDGEAVAAFRGGGLAAAWFDAERRKPENAGKNFELRTGVEFPDVK